MECPGCKYTNNEVVETRQDNSDLIRRRRQCLRCGLRFTTIERIRIPARKGK